jgi:ubiquitin C-terminal hydrolase
MLNGLRNLGNTCYFNAIVQSLSNIESFVNYMKHNIENDLIKDSKERDFAIHLRNILIAMNHVDRKIINPSRLFNEFNKHNNQETNQYNIIGFNNQEDAEEALLQVFNILHEAIKYKVDVSYNGVPKNKRDELMVESLKHWGSYCGHSYSEVIAQFYGQFLSQTLCSNCNYGNNNFEPFLPINIQINNECRTLKQSFELFTGTEEIEGYTCDKCKHKDTSSKQLVLWKSPKILIIVLKRFIGNVKFDQQIEFPEKMNISDYVKGYDTDNSHYVINSVIEHQGQVDYGHYICYCRKKDGYYKFNDDHIEKVNDLKSAQAYILIYDKI